MDILKKVWAWLVWSSNDPAQLSLTLKAGVPFVITIAALSGHVIDGMVADQAAAAIADEVTAVVQVVTGAVALFGLARKIWLTWKA